MTKLITWNVNGIRAIHKKGFLDWMASEDPDILCIQETKAHKENCPPEIAEIEGYHSYWQSAERRGYSGVLTYAKQTASETAVLGDEAFDCEGRVQVLSFDDFVLINAYFPNSQEKGRRIDYKVAFCDRMLERCNDLVANGRHVVLCGDYNIAHNPIDLARPDDNHGNPGFLPQERAWMDRFVDAGYRDSFRDFHPEPDNYTWWSYRTRARERNVGWRIDYHCVNEDFRDHVTGCEILADVMGSDHCPVRLSIKS